ncbi:MAG TPA: putative manganese-dependent inorganic diphosphatase [Candidatus Deferrimicrobium sp.]|nr:putative manganese-dependent inorganic diphosphatase [Candidatus Deferrimicrobium sp.]
MTKPIFVIGHKNPDTDSICAAISYANLKQELGFKHVLPCKAGSINRETQYVLDYFQVPEPELLQDLHTRVKDLLNGNNIMVRPEIPMREAWNVMRSQDIKTLPVVDKANRLLGLVSGGDIADKYLMDLGEQDFGDMRVTVENVVKTLFGTLILGSLQTELKGQVIIGAMQADTMEQYIAPGSVVLVGDREKGQMVALEAGASCLILTGGADLSPKIADKARATGTIVISVPMDTFSAARMILMSIPVGSIMRTNDLTTFQDDDLLDEVKKVMLSTRYRNYPVVNEQSQVVGEIARYHLLGFSKQQVILVDHNEYSQAVDGVEKAQILEVVDHHRVGGIQTGEPILFRNEPVGSTCTLVAKAYFEQGITPSKEMAGIMCAAILSDTVIFKSPTCTRVDQDMADRLAKIAGIEPVEFGTAMFKYASSLKDRSTQDILQTDLKEFKVGEMQMGIGQVSVMGTEEVLEITQALLEEMDNYRSQATLDYVLLMVTDLLTEGTHLLITGPEPGEIGKVFGVTVKDSLAYLPGVMSRKKQIVPPLTKYFNS